MWMFDRAIRWVAIVLMAMSAQAADCCKNSVAVVASLSGSAMVRSPGSHEKASVSSLDWLSDGMTLEVGTRSHAVLILLNGHRYELKAGAKATLTAGAAPKITGAARELPALPPIPQPAPIGADSSPTSGAVRIRGAAEMSELYPRAGTVALPDEVTLRFKAVPDAMSYRVGLENDGGESLLNVTTEFTEVSVPSGSIKAGAHYYWRVRAMRSGTAIGVGMAEFSTLSAESALQRTEFATALGATGSDAATLALLAGIDLRLGLVAEACDEFSAALKQKPEDVTLQRALDSARARLSGGNK
jgi:hypothetical protein